MVEYCSIPVIFANRHLRENLRAHSATAGCRILTLICQPVLAERALAALIAVERALSRYMSITYCLLDVGARLAARSLAFKGLFGNRGL
jgi:hypothetical protein